MPYLVPNGKARKSLGLAGSLFLLLALVACSLHQKPKQTSRRTTLRSSPTSVKELKLYDQVTIERTVPYLDVRQHPRLLVFDGEAFSVYNINHPSKSYIEDTSFGRGEVIVPLMVRSLYNQFPDRFKVGQPVFQMLFLDSDSVSAECAERGSCMAEDFAPIPVFGSVPKKTPIPVKAFPNFFYVQCLFEYIINHTKKCHWQESDEIRHTVPYDQLHPEVIWRGSDFGFLPEHDRFRGFHAPRVVDEETNSDKDSVMTQLMGQWDEMTPRWRAVTLFAKEALQLGRGSAEEPPWIDAKFSGHGITDHHKQLEEKLGVEITQADRMGPEEMATYKYQLAIGGGGGTSWRGTISKLGMPGVLFNVESPTKDWFYDQMQAFKHYIPVEWSMADLKSRYDWAEKNPGASKEISMESSRLHEYLMSQEYMDKVYQELFMDYLGQVVQSFQVSDHPWSTLKKQYLDRGFKLQKVSMCEEDSCRTRGSSGVWNQEVFDK